jgi:hypothetical protein
MRRIGFFLLLPCSVLAIAGCMAQPKPAYSGPKVDSFSGRLTADGKDISFAENETVTLQLQHEAGNVWGVPIKSDGTWKIGWMPEGKYSGWLQRPASAGKGTSVRKDALPGQFVIEPGKTEYTIEMGKNYKP